jgi:histidine triad (HIT) family protein
MASSSSDCLFCKIVAGQIPASIVWQNEHVVVFNDIQPQAPTHWLVIPKQHTESVSKTEDATIFAHVLQGAQAVANQNGLTDYRLVINNGSGAGQTVFHLHLHVLAGRSFHWPPG